jgi:pimeloyl-ACP methyl ester carboxylesterase
MGDYFKVFSLDLRNHGLSPHHDFMSYQVMAQDVCEFVDEHRLSSTFLLGHSMGGKVAMQFALDFPDRVKKLVVVDIAPQAYEPSHRPVLNALLSLDLGMFKSFGEVDSALEVSIPEAAMRQFLLKNLMRDSHGRLRWKIHLEAIARNYDRLIEAVKPQRSFTRSVCFIRGGRSNYLQEKDIPWIRHTFTHAEIETIPGAGHWVHVDAPEEFLSTVVRFLSRSESGV